ncbi:MAG: hypothetical protein IJO63_04835 [Bacilli bacterium]|nr:hypothetical protein [Bacilli bacterium]
MARRSLQDIALNGGSLFSDILNFNEFGTTNLMRQKENYFEKIDISKSKYELRFDYEKGKHIIWDLLFLAEVVERQMDSVALNEVDNIINENNSYGVVKVSILNCYEPELEERLKRAVVVIQKIRDSLGHRVSSSEDFVPFEIINNMAYIKNRHPNNHLNICLPVSYLKNFGSGIISMNQHQEISDEIDDYIAMNLDQEGIYNLATLFYRVEPSKLNELLEITADERGIQDVGRIPAIALNPKCSVTRFLTIVEMLKNNNCLLTVNDLPNILFLCEDADFQSVIGYITDEKGDIHFEWLNGISSLCKCESEKRDNLVKLLLKRTGKKSGITYLKNLPASILTPVNNTERICEILCYLNNVPIVKTFDELPENIDISCLEHLPSVLFHNYCSLENFYYLYKIFPNDIQNIPEICFNCKLSRLQIFVEQILKQNLSINVLNNVDMLIFRCYKDKFNRIIHYVTNENGILDFSLLSQIPKELMMCPIPKIDTLFKFTMDGNSFNLSKLQDIPYVLYSPRISNEQLLEIYNLLNTTNLITIEELKELSDKAFSVSCDKLSFIINKIRQNGLDLSITNSFPYGFWDKSCSYERIIDVLDDIKGDYSLLPNIPESLLYSSKEKYDYLTNLVKVNGKVDFNKISNLPSIFYSYSLDVINKLLEIYNYDISIFNDVPNGIFFTDDEHQQILSNINRENGIFKVSSLQKLPEEFFSCPIEIFQLLIDKANNDLTKLQSIPRILFYAPVECLEIFLKFVTKDGIVHFERLSELPFDFNGMDYSRLKFIYDKVGNNLATINKLPKEIYTCEDAIAESMFEHFETNMMKSLFGINDPKLVALMLYLNETFSNFNNEGIEFLDLKLSALNISIAPEDVMNYVNKLNKRSDKSFDTGSLQWIDGIIQSFNNVRVKGSGSLNSLTSTATVLKGRLQDGNNMFERLSLINKKLVSCLRNASEHLRIYPTDDPDTVRVMDYKYDVSYGMAKKVVSLDCKVKVDDLLAIVNQIETIINDNERTPMNQEYINNRKDFLFGELAHRLNCASNLPDNFSWSGESLQMVVEGNFYLATQNLVDKYISFIVGLLSSEGISQNAIDDVMISKEIDIQNLKQSIESNLCPLQEHLNISGFIMSLSQLGNSIIIECRRRNTEQFTR